IENTLNITDEVIRYLIVRQDEKELAKAKEAKEAKEKADKERAQKEDDTSQEPKANEDDDEANE
ncbi:hypothetical protein KC963_00550, partial [Candidatus Saccharibacteria bacterium]|nr:hypothetical protein [Candidatus Saccharibacteria bacterium]